MDAATWESPDPAEVRVLGSSADWDALEQDCERQVSQSGAAMVPFKRCLEVAQAGGATSVVIETRYIDLDYRSEFSAFYSRTFLSPPPSARRLHFFRATLTPNELWDLPDDHGYLGYVVLRPVALGPVGRTMLRPPPGIEAAVRTAVTERVSFFGQSLEVEAVPFMQQDAQLDRCAHAAAWVCHYSAYRRHQVSRRSMASFSLMADPSLGFSRPIPSEGLTVQQLLELMRLFELPCQFYDIENLPSIAAGPGTPPDPTPKYDASGQRLPAGSWDTRTLSICCRYLNSGIPVLVGNDGAQAHAWVLCGYERQARPGAHDWIRFVRHDDQRGPYLWVEDVLTDTAPAPGGYEYAPWRFLVVPLPEKIWLAPEPAESAAVRLLTSLAQQVVAALPGSPAQVILDRAATGDLRWRAYVRPANDFKAELAVRVDDATRREYRMARFPRHVWVVEVIDRAARQAGRPDVVLGEAVFDATSSGLPPGALALHVPGVMVVYQTNGTVRGPIATGSDPYRSGGVGPA